MLKHEFIVKEIHNRSHTKVKKRLVAVFEDKRYELLGVFLTSEIKNFYEPFYPKLEAILSDNAEEFYFQGNRCSLTVGKDTTVIEDENDVKNLPTVEINNAELSELIEEWKDRKDLI